MRLHRGLAALAILLASGAALAMGVSGSTSAQRDALDIAAMQMREKEYAAADEKLRAILAAPAFSLLEPAERQRALRLSARAALALKDAARAQALYRRCTGLAEADGRDWGGRLDAAYLAKDTADAVLSLTRIASDWPGELPDLNERSALRLIDAAKKLPQRQARFELLDALFQAEWKLEFDEEPSPQWRDLALLLLERKDQARAGAVAARVTSTGSLIVMRVDPRYAALLRADPGHYDIDKAAAAETERWRSVVAQHPRSLQALMELGYALLTTGQYAEVLKLCDEAIRREQAAPRDHAAYDDVGDYLRWVLDNRSRALMGLGRMDQAAEPLEQALRSVEADGSNASQAINLAELYVDLGRPKDALKAIAQVKGASAYGTMQVQVVRHAAAIQSGDAAAADTALAFLREHQEDAVSAYERALIDGNHLDEAARLFIARLDDADRRDRALLAIQDFRDPPPPPWEAQRQVRWLAMLARPDVRAAIARVGRVEKFNIATPL